MIAGPGLASINRYPCARIRIVGGALDAPVLTPSRGSRLLRNFENCARNRMNTGVPRIVTISCTDSDDARWRRPLAQKCGNDWRKEHHDMVRETSRRQINTCDI